MTRLAKADLSLFVELLDMGCKQPSSAMTTQTTAHGRLSDAISQLGKSPKGNPSKNEQSKTWDWYQKHDPDYLNRLEKENPEEFNRLLNEYENSL